MAAVMDGRGGGDENLLSLMFKGKSVHIFEQ